MGVDGIGLAYRQQQGLPRAARTVPDLVLSLVNQTFLCDVTVADTLATHNLAHSKQGPGCLAEHKAAGKVSFAMWQQRFAPHICHLRSRAWAD